MHRKSSAQGHTASSVIAARELQRQVDAGRNEPNEETFVVAVSCKVIFFGVLFNVFQTVNLTAERFPYANFEFVQVCGSCNENFNPFSSILVMA